MGYCSGMRLFSGVFSAAIFLLLSFATQADPSLIAHWPLDEPSGSIATDASGNNQTASLVSAPTPVSGRVNGAYAFNGSNQALVLNNLAGLNAGNTPHTLAAWVKVNSLPVNRAWLLLLGNEGQGAHHWLLSSNGQTQFGVWSGGQTQPALGIGVWRHIATSFDGATYKLYVDGNESASVAASFALSGMPLTLAQPHVSENGFDGALDDVRVYNRSLSAAEIAALANPASSNQPPSVSLTSPANGASYTAPATITLTANATDADGTVTKVEFYNGPSLIATDSNANDGWGITWNAVPAGTYTLSASAFDNAGASTASASVSITVVNSGGAPSAGLLAYYPFDEVSGATAQDASGNNQHAALSNAPTWSAGRVNGALFFDGIDDGLRLANLAGLNPGNTPHTLAAWVKVNSLPLNRAWLLLLGNEGQGAHHWLLNSNGISQLGSWGGNQVQPALSVGQWQHLALSFDGSTLTGYINGNPIGAVSASFNLAGMPLTVAQAHINEDAFNGQLDDVRIYNRALSASEIGALANPASANQPPSITLTSPAHNASFSAPANITLTATARDSDGTITQVEFYNGSALIATDTSAADGWGTSWTAVPQGTYSLSAKAFDDSNASTSSASVNIVVAKPAFGSIVPGSVLPLSPTVQGYPRIQFFESATGNPTQFSIARGMVGNIACPSTGETPGYDSSANITWCYRDTSPSTTDPAYSLVEQSGVWIYTDKLVRLDDIDTREFKYQVRNSSDTSFSYVGIWTASCSTAITDGQDPVSSWVSAFNQRIGAITPVLSRSDIPDPVAATPNIPVLVSKSVTYNGTPTTLYIVTNDKYIAVFSQRGNLVGLTHRALGEEFITHGTGDANNTLRDPFSIDSAWAWLIKTGDATRYNPDVVCPQQSATGINLISSLVGTVGAPTLEVSGKVTFTWSGIPNFNGTVSTVWSMPSVDGSNGAASGLRGQLIVSGSPTTGGYLCASFPRLTGLGLQSSSATPSIDLVWPSSAGSGPNNSGSVLKNYSQSSAGYGASAHAGLQLQFAGVSKGPHSLYVSTEDATNKPKTYSFLNYWVSSIDQKSNAGDTYLDHFPVDGTGVTGNTLQLNYDNVLKPMCGGWDRMAKQYRNWATKQSWATNADGSPRITANRTDISLNARDGLFWWLSFLGAANTPADLVSYVQTTTNNLKAEIGPTTSGGNVPVGIHLYQWYQELFDQKNPEFTALSPAPDGTTIEQAIFSIRADKTVVVPYINMSSIDISNRLSPNYSGNGCPVSNSHGWWSIPVTYGPLANEYLNNFLMERPAVTSTGENLYVFCNSSAPSLLASADPSLVKWQQVNQFNVDKVFNLGADGVYLDTYGTGYRPDFNTTHMQHALGHGTWWLDGMRTIGANAIERAQSSGTGIRGLVTGEYFNETLMPYTDIVMNYESPRLTDVPLLWTVYSGYQMYAGGTPNNAATDAARTAILGRSFVWGYQLGLSNGNTLCSSPTGTCDPNYPVVAYLRSLAQARNTSFLRQYLSYGELLQITDDIDTSSGHLVSYTGIDAWCSNASCTGSAPAVRGARWRGQGGDGEIILLTNTTPTSMTATIAMPATWDGATLCNADGSDCATISAANGVFSVYVSGGDIKLLKKM